MLISWWYGFDCLIFAEVIIQKIKVMKDQEKLIWADKKEFTIRELNDLAHELIGRTWTVSGKEYNLLSLGWRFSFNEHKTSLGICYTRQRRIELSLEWVKINTSLPADMEDVIRHEIAHAIDYHKRRTTDHSKAWKRVCVQVGALPERLYKRKEAQRPASKYILKCDKCGHESRRHRVGDREYSCGPCGNGRYDPNLKLKVIKNW